MQTNTTITAMNAADCAPLPSFLKSLGVSRFAMNLYMPSGHGQAPRGGHADGLFFPYSKAGEVIESVRRAARAPRA